MKITTEITVTVERADGTMTSVTNRTNKSAGDNPRFERDEVTAAVADGYDAFAWPRPDGAGK